jgi:hypothetical protein
MLSLHINNLNSRKMTHQYIQEPIISLNHFYFNIHSIIHAVCYWRDVFLLSLFYVFMFVISYLFFSEDIPVCIPLFLILQNMAQGHVCRRTLTCSSTLRYYTADVWISIFVSIHSWLCPCMVCTEHCWVLSVTNYKKGFLPVTWQTHHQSRLQQHLCTVLYNQGVVYL